MDEQKDEKHNGIMQGMGQEGYAQRFHKGFLPAKDETGGEDPSDKKSLDHMRWTVRNMQNREPD